MRIAALFLLLSIMPVLAADAPQKPMGRWSCWAVRASVAKHGEAVVTAMARAAGISEAEIERARKCLVKS